MAVASPRLRRIGWPVTRTLAPLLREKRREESRRRTAPLKDGLVRASPEGQWQQAEPRTPPLPIGRGLFALASCTRAYANRVRGWSQTSGQSVLANAPVCHRSLFRPRLGRKGETPDPRGVCSTGVLKFLRHSPSPFAPKLTFGSLRREALSQLGEEASHLGDPSNFTGVMRECHSAKGGEWRGSFPLFFHRAQTHGPCAVTALAPSIGASAFQRARHE
jgi:hypothetical protein